MNKTTRLFAFLLMWVSLPAETWSDCGIPPIPPVAPIGCRGGMVPQYVCDGNGQHYSWNFVCSSQTSQSPSFPPLVNSFDRSQKQLMGWQNYFADGQRYQQESRPVKPAKPVKPDSSVPNQL